MDTLTTLESALRLLAAFAAGAVLGLERESRGRPAGLRTTILACLAAAIAMVLSEVLFIQSAGGMTSNAWRPDPARLGAGILTGIGFLGAGTILRNENMVRGVTTAATLWFVTVLGLTFGAGEYLLGLIGTGLAFLALTTLPSLEKWLHKDSYVKFSVTGMADSCDEADIRKRVEGLKIVIKTLAVRHDILEQQKTVEMELRMAESRLHQCRTELLKDFAARPGILVVNWG